MDLQREVMRAIPMMPWLAALVLMAALAAAAGTLYMVGQVSSVAREAHTQETPNYRIEREPLAKAEYAELMSWMRNLHPGVEIAQSKTDGLLITTNTGMQHAEWLYALSALQSNGADVIWEASEFCVGRCDGQVAMAAVTGYRQKLVKD